MMSVNSRAHGDQCASASSPSIVCPDGIAEADGFGVGATVGTAFAGAPPSTTSVPCYKRDSFCLDAADFGHDPTRGAMDFHATNASLLRGPIDVNRPQALMFDADGRVLGVEYEIMAEAVRDVPALFGRASTKLPAHAGVAHEHYALHLWFIQDPSGRFADFNPRLSCPLESAPGGHPPATGGPESSIPPKDHNAPH